ncbi:MAG: hypothetical protein K2P58_10225 [Hyphomonadaceae bacterium]|nr:hypothetical protein [Hyphomonadaceae bacterium]
MNARVALLALLLLTIGACATTTEEPIVGCWQRENTGYSLVFRADRTAEFELSWEASESSIDYYFPRVRWAKRRTDYVLRFSRALQAGYTTTARIEGSLLFVRDWEAPLTRATAETCYGWN